jgi:hypothetical protein
MKLTAKTFDRFSANRSELAISFKILIPTGLIFILFVYFSYFVMLPDVQRQLMNQKREHAAQSGQAWPGSLMDYYHQTQPGRSIDVEKPPKPGSWKRFRECVSGPTVKIISGSTTWIRWC